MWQRLVITIEDKNGLLAKAYYHWSGYTSSGLAITNIAVKHFESAVRTAAYTMAIQRITNTDMAEDDFVHRTKVAIACHMLFTTNAGLETTETSPEDEAFKNMFPGCNYMVGTLFWMWNKTYLSGDIKLAKSIIYMYNDITVWQLISEQISCPDRKFHVSEHPHYHQNNRILHYVSQYYNK